MPDPLSHAFGSPGISPRWTSSAKAGVGTAYSTSCFAWFTLSHGIVNEIYYPNIDSPNTRDLQLLITDGRTFFHEEKRDLHQTVELPDPEALLYRLVGTDPQNRYRLVKEVITDPHRSVVLLRVQLEYIDPALRGQLRIFGLLAPHLARQGAANCASWCELSTGNLLHAQRDRAHLAFGCDVGFSRRSVGYVGASDGWLDLQNFEMDWTFNIAGPGNVALTGEVNLAGRSEFILGVGFGSSNASAVTALLQSFATPFETHRATFIDQWHRSQTNDDDRRPDLTPLGRMSRMILLAHEDKIYHGAMAASLSIPWGEAKGDEDAGGYHLIWTRDLVHSATALLSSGQTGTPLRALIWLAATQAKDGGVPQNSWTDGSPFLSGIQLDETAALLLLASRLRSEKALGLFDPWAVIEKAVAFLVESGPVTDQDRWEENAGFSPSTLAAVVAGIAGASDFAEAHGATAARDFMLSYADWINAYIEPWTVTSFGTLHPDVKRHYIRITPGDPSCCELKPDPDGAEVEVKNQGGRHPAREIVSADFLQLVRFGLRAADDPLVRDSLQVVDHVLRHDLPTGPAWRRYPFDGYGQKSDGGPFDGTGVGRCWPILTGERGHYEIAAGRDASLYIQTIEKFANEGQLLPEQVWDEPDLPDGSFRLGGPTGSAMPLCWSHAEYLALLRSQRDGKVFDRIETAYQRYANGRREFQYEMWSHRYRRDAVLPGKTLRLVAAAAARVLWTTDNWATQMEGDAAPTGLTNLWYMDLPTEKLPPGSVVEFTFFWSGSQNWEGSNFRITLQAAG